VVLCKEKRAILAENERPEDLVELAMVANADRNNGVIRQYQSALMHYNELQLWGVEVEAMSMKFEQRVAEEVAKAGYRQKPSPKQKKNMSTAIDRGDPTW
jgi:outer membrane protein assembly factor BamD (BamD/ComL family)